MKKIAISIGDLNGVGFEIALNSHEYVKTICKPYYCISKEMALQASKLLNRELPNNFECIEIDDLFEIEPSISTIKSGKSSYNSFLKAIELTENRTTDAVVTLPISKEAWSKAGILYKGHTEVLRDIFKQDAIMMLGCDKLFVALFTEHIPLKDIFSHLTEENLTNFLINFYNSIKIENIGVLGLNPHAGDSGVIGDEELIIDKSIKEANKILKKDVFKGALVPDVAFTKKSLLNFNYFVAMYHDQGLIAVKSLFFEESINVSLNLPIIRTSVDHGTAFDIAYKNQNPSNLSYINAIKEACKLSSNKIL